MALSPDFSDSIPVDHVKLNTNSASLRAIRALLGDRLSAIISGFVSGETVKGILNLPFIAQSTPGTVAGQIQLYGKVVSGKTELHSLSEDGVENQLTSLGALNITPLATILNTIYPVGIVVTLGVSTNPATLFGIGTWTAISGRVIVGIDAGQTEFDTLDETGGAKTHTLSTSEIPSHTHGIHNSNGGGGGGGDLTNLQKTDNTNLGGINTDAAGGGGAHNNLQPYIVKYVWQRTA